MKIVLVALLALPLVGGCADPEPRTVELTIRHSRFVPGEVRVPAGSEVRFVIRNTDPIDHEFLLGDQPFQDRHEEGTEAHHGARPGEVSLPAGVTGTTTYRFGEQGRLLMGCHLPGHWDYGMKGAVIVG